MENVLELIVQRFEVFLLLMARCSAIFLLTPVFGQRNMPAVFKIGLAVMTSIILLNTVEMQNGLPEGLMQLSVVIIKEVIVGLIIGYVTFVVFSSIYFAGQIIDMKTGFGIVNILDPQTNTQVPIMGNFLYIFTLVIFITIDGHHMLLTAMVKSFEIVPIGRLQITAGAVEELTSILMGMFITGLKISAPVIAAVLLSDIALGILAKTMPQMNVFMVGMPLKIFIGMLTLLIMIPVFAIVMEVLVGNTADGIYRILIQLK